uniref:Ribonuclease H-like domain, reverse transcriptase, RNA-dependent DNA polymerase n=1 Tax=Tanacetum cinerariifolium TaxID=118510 RepID=A0A6L2NQV7_TANCI|nr:ribonuclease H-like domain, reverse transcriptase, RNA-dependent DNA polymerase [Tanacetum cinerariifolium]
MVLLPLWSTGLKDPHNTDADAAFDDKENESEVYVSPNSNDKQKKHDEQAKREAEGKSLVEFAPVTAVGPNSTNSTNSFSAAGPSNTTVSPSFEIGRKSSFVDPSQYPDDPNMPALEDIIFSDDEEDGHTQEEGINYEEVFAPDVRVEAIRLFLAYASFIAFMVYQMDVKSTFLYETIKEEVYVCQPLGFKDPDYPDKIYKVVKELYGLHQAPRAWYETLANYLLENGFQRGKIIKKQKVKRMFRYLKGKPHLGLWYPKDSFFNLVAYSDSDYAGASLDRKSTTRGCQFLVCRLISWQCKKQTVVATSSTEAEYVAVASFCAQVLWIQN